MTARARWCCSPRFVPVGRRMLVACTLLLCQYQLSRQAANRCAPQAHRRGNLLHSICRTCDLILPLASWPWQDAARLIAQHGPASAVCVHLCRHLQVNPDALPAAPGPQFKVQLNTGAAAADSRGAAAGAGGAAVTKTASTSVPPPAAAAAVSKKGGNPAGATKAGKAAAGGPAAGTYYIEQASHTQPPLLQSLKPAAGKLGKTGSASIEQVPLYWTIMLQCCCNRQSAAAAWTPIIAAALSNTETCVTLGCVHCCCRCDCQSGRRRQAGPQARLLSTATDAPAVPAAGKGAQLTGCQGSSSSGWDRPAQQLACQLGHRPCQQQRRLVIWCCGKVWVGSWGSSWHRCQQG